MGRAVRVRDAVSVYLRQPESWSTCSRMVRAGLARAHVFPAFGAVDVDLVTGAAVRDWLSRKLASGYSASFVRQMLRVLRGGLEVAVAAGVIPQNPCEGVVVGDVPAPRLVVLSDAELDALHRACRTPAQHLVLTVATGAGLRPHEVEALSWSWVDVAARRITVPLDVGPGARRHGRRPRTVPVSVELVQDLEDWRGAHRSSGVRVFDGVRIGHEIARLGADSGVPVSLLALRDVYVARLVSRGTPLGEVRGVAGFATLRDVRLRYGHLAPLKVVAR